MSYLVRGDPTVAAVKMAMHAALPERDPASTKEGDDYRKRARELGEGLSVVNQGMAYVASWVRMGLSQKHQRCTDDGSESFSVRRWTGDHVTGRRVCIGHDQGRYDRPPAQLE